MIEILRGANSVVGDLAAHALEEYGEAGLNPLIEALPGAKPLTQVKIVTALEHIGSREAVAPLLDLLALTDIAMLRYTIIQALGAIGDARAFPLIRSFAEDADHHVRERVKMALAQLEAAVTDPAWAEQEAARGSGKSDKLEILLDGKRIFVVEDDVANMAIYAVTLKKSGATVIQDHWNADTPNLLAQHLPVDIILLDLMLRQGISGYDIFDQLRLDPVLGRIPVIAVSAFDPEVEIPKAKARGFAGYISKPINLQKFPAQVAACLGGQPVWVASY
jgi:CheY-like chemotaxis protein